MTEFNFPHDELAGSHAAPDCVSITILSHSGKGLTISLPVSILTQLQDAHDTLEKPSGAEQKMEMLRRFKRYLKRPNDDQGKLIALLGYYTLCAIAPETPARLSDVIRRCGSGCVTVLVNLRKRTFIGVVPEIAPGAEELPDILDAAKHYPTRMSYSAQGWKPLPATNHR